MFTGIIQDIGTVHSFHHEENQSEFVFFTRLNMKLWQLGDSVAVDGCCLTITCFPDDKKHLFSAILSLETLKLTRFSALMVGDGVNLEPALCMGDALGGHMVTGHVDALARVVEISEIGEHKKIDFEAPNRLRQYLVSKGSVTLNGVSLTVNAVENRTFSINLIPHTLKHTNLGMLNVGNDVNIETDLMGRYVERILLCKDEDAQQEI